MTVGTTQPHIEYLENGSTTVHPVPFEFLSAGDLIVSRIFAGVEAVLGLGSGYTVSGGNGAAGSIAKASGGTAGAILRIRRRTSRAQSAEYAFADKFPAETNEKALDRAAMVDQEQDEELRRGVKVPLGEVGLQLPPAAERAGKFQAYDADGRVIAATGTGNDPALRTDLASESGGSLLILHRKSGSSTFARSARQWAKVGGMDDANIFNWVHPDLDAGIVDRSNLINLRTSFANALAERRGGRIVLPEGAYRIDTTAGALTLEEVVLEGEEVLDGSTGTLDQGVMLEITGSAHNAFKVRRGTCVKGLGIYYPDQVDSATPIPFPATFAVDFSDGAVQFVRLCETVVYNAFRWLDIDDGGFGNIGHVDLTGNVVCALDRGVFSSHNLEHIRARGNNFTFGHWLEATEGGARSYYRANCKIFDIAKSDGWEIVDNLLFGALAGLKTSSAGLCQFMNFSLNKVDQVRYGLLAEGPGNFDGNIIGNTWNCFNPQNTSLGARCVTIATTGSAIESITLDANNFDLATEDHVLVTGNPATRTLVVGANNHRSWAAYKSSGAYGALNVSGALTNLNLSGGTMFGIGNAAHSNGVMGSMNTLQVTGSTFIGCKAPLNVTTNTAVISGNQSFSTNGATSDIINATLVRQSGNLWDKPSGSGAHAFLARKNSSQTVNATTEDIVFGSETFDSDEAFASAMFTAKAAGIYAFEFGLMHDASVTAGDRWNVAVMVNASVAIDFTFSLPAAAIDSIGRSFQLKLAAGDAVKLQLRRTGGAGSFTTFNDPLANFFSGRLVA